MSAEKPAWMHKDFRYPPSSAEAIAARSVIKTGPDYVPNMIAGLKAQVASLKAEVARLRAKGEK